MHFSEDDLRNALKRQDPGPIFTQRVMAGIKQAGTKAPVRGERAGFFSNLFSLRLRPALAGALAVLVLLAGGLGYLQHERKKQREQALAKEAERQAIIALRITNAKLNRVFQRVRESQENDSKIRRERL